MGKNPAFQFYPADWTRDLDDQDLEVEGAWIRICCRLWWSETKGEATKPLKEWARILRKTEKKTKEILKILLEKSISSGAILDNQNITIISRRMVKDTQLSQLRREVGRLGGNPNLKKDVGDLDNQTDNQKPTPSSSSSTSSSKKEKIIKKENIQLIENKFTTIPVAFMEKWREVAPGINIEDEIKKAELWLLAHPEKRRSRYGAFLSNWMVKAQNDFIKYGGNGNGSYGKPSGFNPAIQRTEGTRDPEAQEIWERYHRKIPNTTADDQAADVPEFDSGGVACQAGSV